MSDLILAAVAVAVVLAYVCHTDDLSWWRQPILMLAHFSGGSVAVWVLSVSAMGEAGAVHVGALLADVVALAWLYRHLPARQGAASAAAPAPVPAEALRHVSGGSKDSG